MTSDLRPMGIGDILDTAIKLYKRRFATFVTISAVVYLPYALAMALLTSLARSFGMTPSTGGDTSFWSRVDFPRFPSSVASSLADASAWSAPGTGFGAMGLSPLALVASALVAFVGAMLFLGLVYPLCSGALILNISAGYLGEELSAAESYGRVLRRLGRLLTAQFLVTLWVALGILFCVVPGILISLRLMVVPAVVLLEAENSSGSLRRSRALMAGNLGKGFLLGLVAALLGAVVSAAGGWVIRLVPWPSEFLATFLVNLLPAFTLPLSAGTMVLLYYDLRIRKEAFDLQHLAAKMGDLRAE
jgi:MFS family permease